MRRSTAAAAAAWTEISSDVCNSLLLSVTDSTRWDVETAAVAAVFCWWMDGTQRRRGMHAQQSSRIAS